MDYSADKNGFNAIVKNEGLSRHPIGNIGNYHKQEIHSASEETSIASEALVDSYQKYKNHHETYKNYPVSYSDNRVKHVPALEYKDYTHQKETYAPTYATSSPSKTPTRYHYPYKATKYTTIQEPEANVQKQTYIFVPQEEASYYEGASHTKDTPYDKDIAYNKDASYNVDASHNADVSYNAGSSYDEDVKSKDELNYVKHEETSQELPNVSHGINPVEIDLTKAVVDSSAGIKENVQNTELTEEEIAKYLEEYYKDHREETAASTTVPGTIPNTFRTDKKPNTTPGLINYSSVDDEKKGYGYDVPKNQLEYPKYNNHRPRYHPNHRYYPETPKTGGPILFPNNEKRNKLRYHRNVPRTRVYHKRRVPRH